MSEKHNHLDFEKPKRRELTPEERREKAERAAKRRSALVPKLPELGIDPATLGRGSRRAAAVVNLRIAGAPFHEIAEQLEYDSAASAKKAYAEALASMNPVEDWETLRQAEALRAETLFRRSLAMASADYLIVREIDDDGNEVEVRIPNADRLRWHEQAGKDLALHAMITGAKAPARVEVSATTQELNQMVQVLLTAETGSPHAIEADIWDADVVEDAPEEQD